MLLVAGAIVLFSSLDAQIPDRCEGSIPAGWSALSGRLSLSKEHYKVGEESLRWQWHKKTAYITIKDTAFGSAARDPRSTFVIWIYNEKPIKDKLLFEFKKNDASAEQFYFNLDFEGWRTAWVMYHRDMDGQPVDGMNELTIRAPRSVNKGTLYFDQVIYNTNINPRSPMRDEQVPFVNVNADKAANAHWTALYWFNRIPHYLELASEISKNQTQEFEQILSRHEDVLFTGTRYRQISFGDMKNDFDFWKIERKKHTITGGPVYSVNDVELFPDGTSKAVKDDFKKNTISAYTELMLRIAGVHRASVDVGQKAALEKMFIDMLDHLYNQGWAAGSGMGALHHLGYNFRDYYTACLLMKPVIKQYGLLQRTWKTMYWFSGLGRTQKKDIGLSDSNIDVLNTLLPGMLSAILIMDDTPEKVRQLKEFSNWLSKVVMPTYAINGTFKPDGSVIHHGNLYPAYGVGGLQGVAPVIYALSKTSFQIQPESMRDLKRVMFRMHDYTNPLYWPVSVSGRHPTGNWKIAADAYAYLALAGSEDGREDIDSLMASIYLRIAGDQNNKWVTRFKNSGFQPSGYPQGHWNINYGLLDIHRRNDWLLTIRGHNRYFTTHEAYPGANMYGRYLSYGFLEVTWPQSENNRGSSFKDEGWDWNNIPGTTSLHLPIEKLRANILNVDDFSGVEEMLISDQVFAGGTNWNHQDGVFAMKLHGHDKYDMGSFWANKSWFMFDSIIVCLGSDISNSISQYRTQTTLFQNVLDSKSEEFDIDGQVNNGWPYEQTWRDGQEVSIVDNRHIGYYIPDAENLIFIGREQQSRDQKDQRDTKGNVATLVWDHGKAPVKKGYEYAMLPGTTPVAMAELVKTMKSDHPVYQVLRKDSLVHALYYAPKKMTALALFNHNLGQSDSLILSNNRPALVMYRMQNDTLSMSVTDPDLEFYSGPDDSPVDENGRRKEVSIYSRKWYKTPSQPSVLDFSLKGKWKLISDDNRMQLTYLVDGNTQVSIPCEYGLASRVELAKKDD